MRISNIYLEGSSPENDYPLVVDRYFIQKMHRSPLGYAKGAKARTYWRDAMMDCNLDGMRDEDQGRTTLKYTRERADEGEVFRLIKRTSHIYAEVME